MSYQILDQIAANEWAKHYWLSKPPEVRRLDPNVTNTEAERQIIAVECADKGHIVDVPIMVFGAHPYHTMLIRQGLGFTWVPSALQAPVNVAPGLQFPGEVPYDPDKPPQGSIKVSVDPKDYPPFNPPVVQLPPNTVAVGAYTGLLNRYFSLPAGIGLPNGHSLSQDGGTFVKRVQANAIGTFHYFERQ